MGTLHTAHCTVVYSVGLGGEVEEDPKKEVLSDNKGGSRAVWRWIRRTA